MASKLHGLIGKDLAGWKLEKWYMRIDFEKTALPYKELPGLRLFFRDKKTATKGCNKDEELSKGALFVAGLKGNNKRFLFRPVLVLTRGNGVGYASAGERISLKK